MESVIVVGGGKVGSHLAGLLLAGKYRVKVVENHPAHVAELQRDLPPETLIEGSGSDPDVLERAGVRQAAVVAAVTGNDETNLVVTNLARLEFHTPRTIARINNPKNSWLFTPEMGVDVAVDQADMIAKVIAEEMSLGDVITLLKLRKGQFSLVEESLRRDAAAVGRAIKDLALPEECMIMAVIRRGQLLIPKGSTVLLPDDEVLALVHSAQVSRLAALLGPSAST